MTHNYDAKCYDLACHFLEDHPEINTEPVRDALAKDIQEVIENGIRIAQDFKNSIPAKD